MVPVFTNMLCIPVHEGSGKSFTQLLSAPLSGKWSWIGLVWASPNYKLVQDRASQFVAGPVDL